MKSSRRISVLAAFVGATALLVGPTVARAEVAPPGDIPDNQAFVSFTGPGYSVKVPEGWPRTQTGSRVTFADKYNSIRVEISMRAKAPTVRSVLTSEVARLRATTKGFALLKVTSVTRPAGPSILLTYRAMSPPNAVTGKTVTNDVERYEFWRSGKLVVMTLQAPKGSDNVDPWKIVTDSFTWSK